MPQFTDIFAGAPLYNYCQQNCIGACRKKINDLGQWQPNFFCSQVKFEQDWY